jgi:hypothetical protein
LRKVKGELYTPGQHHCRQNLNGLLHLQRGR